MQAIERIRVAMYHESDDLEFACNPAAMTEVLAHIDALTAELAASDIAIAEYRQQCLDNAAEIARLRSESEERLQNCAALVAEVERLRAAPATAPEQCWCRTCRPITQADNRMVLCPDCGNKRCPKATDHRNACTGSNEPGQPGSSYPTVPATAPEQPAWHDAPTCAGVWICDKDDICYTWTALSIEILDQSDLGEGLRWFGPIPEDKK